MAIRNSTAFVVFLLSGCSASPAIVALHNSQPSESGSDTSVDMLGAGGCLDRGGTSVCAFVGPRRVDTAARENTEPGLQIMTLHRWRRE